MAERRPLIKESLYLLNICGISLSRQTLWGATKFVIMPVIATIMVFELLLELVVHWDGINSMYGLALCAGAYQLFSKTVVVYYHRRKFIKVINILGKFWQVNNLYSSEEERKEVGFIYYRTKFILQTITLTTFMFAVGFFGTSYFYRALPLKTYHPVDPTKSPQFELAFAFDVSYALFNSLPTYFAFEWLFITFIIYIFCECKLIGGRIMLLPRIFKDDKDSEKVFKEFGLIVSQHSLVLSFVQELNNIYSVMLLNHFFSSLFCIGNSLAGLVIKGTTNTDEFLHLCLFSLHFSGQLFVYCLGGTIIMISCENVTYAIHQSEWWRLKDPKAQKTLILITQRSQIVEKITAGGMFELSLVTFARIMNAAVSFFNVFKASYQGE